MAPTVGEFSNILCKVDVIIPLNGQTSGDALLGGTNLVAVLLPAALTGVTMTFTGSVDSTTFVPVYAVDGASAYSITVGTSRIVPVDIRVFAGLRNVRVVSGAAEGAARTITLITRPV